MDHLGLSPAYARIARTATVMTAHITKYITGDPLGLLKPEATYWISQYRQLLLYEFAW